MSRVALGAFVLLTVGALTLAQTPPQGGWVTGRARMHAVLTPHWEEWLGDELTRVAQLQP